MEPHEYVLMETLEPLTSERKRGSSVPPLAPVRITPWIRATKFVLAAGVSIETTWSLNAVPNRSRAILFRRLHPTAYARCRRRAT